METTPKEVLIYATPDGREPFTEWVNALRDQNARARIKTRLSRVEQGNLGDYQPIDGGVCELRIDYGPGYRVYFGQLGTTLVIICCGGDKSSQDKDIAIALKYWSDYKEKKNA
jgi:putative addiction module killer protein